MDQEQIKQFLIDNKEYLDWRIKSLTSKRDCIMNLYPSYANETKKTYDDKIRSMLNDIITKNLACSTEDCMIVLNDYEIGTVAPSRVLLQ